MSSSGDSSHGQIVHIVQPPISSGASSVITDRDMQPSGGGVVCPVGGASHGMVSGVSQSPHAQQQPCPQPDSASSSQQYSVEEQVTTVRIPMRRASSAFLEILHEVGARGEIFTMNEIIHHVKNYIKKHQLFDRIDPRVVHCGQDKLGRVFDVDHFTINEAVSLFFKHTFPVSDSCIRIRRQLVKKAVISSGAASTSAVPQDGSCVTSTVTSTMENEGMAVTGIRQGSVRVTGSSRQGPSTSSTCYQTPPTTWEKDEPGPSEGGCRTAVNMDEVDGVAPMFQVNMQTNNLSSQISSQASEEDSVSVEYDSDHFAVELQCEVEPCDHHSGSQHSSRGTAKRRPSPAFLEVLHEGGAQGEIFTLNEIIHHVKNYIKKHQLFDHMDPRMVHCGQDKLGRVFDLDHFTISEAVPLFIKHTFPVPNSHARIRQQPVRKEISPGASCEAGIPQDGSCVTSTVTSTTENEGMAITGIRQDSMRVTGSSRQGPSTSSTCHQTPPTTWEKDEPGPSERRRRTSVNIEYGDEVDGTAPMFQVNMETSSLSSQIPSQAPEEDSVSVEYDSDQFAVEYEVEPSDHRSESEHSSHGTAKDFVVVQKESDVEFWADYSETETNSDTELGDADHWRCEMCHTLNVPFYRNCSKCWTLRPDWLPDSSLPSSSSRVPLPSEPCGIQHGYYDYSSNDEQLGSSQGSLKRWRLGDKVRRRRVRVMSASSSERGSESLASLTEDDIPTASTRGGREGTGERENSEKTDDLGVNSTPQVSSQELASTEGADSLFYSQPTRASENVRRSSGGKMRRGRKNSDNVVTSADVCVACVSRPKTGCIIHGSSGHQVCCYSCAKRLWREGLPCPVCRRTIQKVIKNFVV